MLFHTSIALTYIICSKFTFLMIYPLLLQIKLWAKINEVSASGKMETHFSNYALIILILFYMMNESKVIPSVKELRILDHNSVSGNGKKCEFITDENNFNFYGSNNSKILDQVSGFFKYYKNFNFSDSVICPLDGSYSCRDLSLPLSFLCQENSKTVDTAIILQDPFETERNLTRQMQRPAVQR